MYYEAERPIRTSHREAAQSLALFAVVLFLVSGIGSDGAALILGIVSFCIVFMTIVAASLFLIEGRLSSEKPAPMVRFCLPAVGALGFSVALFAASAFWELAFLASVIAFGFAIYRRAAEQGRFNLIPMAAFDVGVAAGLGAVLGGTMLILVSAVV